MKWRRTAAPAADMSVQARQEARAAIARELEDWRGRRADVTARLDVARPRAQALAEQAAAALLDGGDLKAIRKDRGAVLAEIEELELAVTMTAERIATLEAELQRAERGTRVAAAVERLDRLAEIAARVDDAWIPMRRQFEELVLAQRETEEVLTKVAGGRFHVDGEDLLSVLMWRTADLFGGVPRAEARHRVPVVEYLGYKSTRAKLEAELRSEEATR